MNIRSGLRHRKGAAFVAALAAASIIVFGGCSMGTAADNSVGEMQPAQQTADVSGLSEARNTPVVRAAKAVGPAVVGITNKAVARDWFNNPVETEGVGSGVIFRKDGYIVTNNHVISGAKEIIVSLSDGRSLKESSSVQMSSRISPSSRSMRTICRPQSLATPTTSSSANLRLRSATRWALSFKEASPSASSAP